MFTGCHVAVSPDAVPSLLDEAAHSSLSSLKEGMANPVSGSGMAGQPG